MERRVRFLPATDVRESAEFHRMAPCRADFSEHSLLFLDSLSGGHSLMKIVLALAHFGHQIGRFPHRFACAPTGKDQLYRGRAVLQQGKHLFFRNEPQRNRHVDFVENDQVIYLRPDCFPARHKAPLGTFPVFFLFPVPEVSPFRCRTGAP